MNGFSKIYVLAPAYFATGGTELLHQFVHKLIHIYGVDAYIFYSNVNWKIEVHPTPSRFLKYTGGTYVEEIEDEENNIIIVPETSIFSIEKFKNIQKVIWWLSVDNFFNVCGIDIYKKSFGYKLKNLVKEWFGRYPYKTIKYTFKSKEVKLHLAQSRYAYEFLISKGVNHVEYLSDYINCDTVNQKSPAIKQNQILFNPLKGKEFTDQLIAATPDLKWVPLQKMTPTELSSWFSSSKLYIDFGNHPGKDRMPREAALNKCIVITNKRGAAKFVDDLPIPENYKLDDNQSISIICEKIRYCLSNYDSLVSDFDNYRCMILKEELQFEKQIENVLKVLSKNVSSL